MNRWIYIARRLSLNGDGERTTVNRAVAITTIAIAVAVMIVSLCVTTGFKRTIEGKLYGLVPHIEVYDAWMPSLGDSAMININDVRSVVNADPKMRACITSVTGTMIEPLMLKTEHDFEALQLRGVDRDYDGEYLAGCIVDGTMPSPTDTTAIILSETVADRLSLNVGERVNAYFAVNGIKVRKLTVVGVFNTQLDAFDRMTAIGNKALLEVMTGSDTTRCHTVEITLKDPVESEAVAISLYAALMVNADSSQQYTMVPVTMKHRSFFAWLDMLDTNVAVIIVLMLIVSCFAVISTLLMIVLRRTRTIGLLKALGTGNAGVRTVFIAMTAKVVVQAMVIGNVLAITLMLLQQHFHIIKLDPVSYYMNSVPVVIPVGEILLLNLGFIAVALLALWLPSTIVSRVQPGASMRVE